MELKSVDIIMKEDDEKKLLRELFELQEQRVVYCNEFEIQFKEYLLDAPEFKLDKLKHLCKTISEKMNSVSANILSIKQQLSSDLNQLKSIHYLIDKLQNNEQTKFQLTLELYICEQKRLEKLATTDEEEFIYREKIKSLKKRMNEIKLVINECLEEIRYEMLE